MNLQMGLRRGLRPRALVTTTPRPIDLLKQIREGKRTVTTTGRTDENVSLDERFVEAMVATYGGTRIGRQELDGELIEQIEGALWTRELIERCRSGAPVCERIVVGVDPPAGVGAGCDACGIVVCGRRGDDLYVLADETVEGLTPGPTGSPPRRRAGVRRSSLPKRTTAARWSGASSERPIARSR